MVQILQYAKTMGWKRSVKSEEKLGLIGKKQVYLYQPSRSPVPFELVVPIRESCTDYDLRIEEVLAVLAYVESRTTGETYDAILEDAKKHI
jgi:hypothetical protein